MIQLIQKSVIVEKLVELEKELSFLETTFNKSLHARSKGEEQIVDQIESIDQHLKDLSVCLQTENKRDTVTLKKGNYTTSSQTLLAIGE
ncbi:hypothetical protein ACFFIX_09265 [Metabacillus herbersteinensis]|uniref:Uncharacterized protein n=1 Tax=Metabacillus herbersteinensis TaxID=283816 RepID=A0ABV6GDN2_9BACI